MERIKQAIARAKEGRVEPLATARTKLETEAPKPAAGPKMPAKTAAPADGLAPDLCMLDRKHLQEMRVITHDGADRRTASYDMLRTQILQILQATSLKTIAVTSPTPGCGKTITSINLAFSIARQSEQSVLLVDLDLRKPLMAHYLGLRPTYGIDDVLAGACSPEEAMMVPNLGDGRVSVLATPHPVPQSTELIASPTMQSVTDGFRADRSFSVVIYDMPPLLSSDDFLAFAPQVDCALLVAAAGETTVKEIAECDRLIGDDKFLGCVLNKASVEQSGYAYYG